MRSWDYDDSSTRSWAGFLAGAGVGAACMYLIDPNLGARRRGVLRDKVIRAGHSTVDGLEASRRDLANRARGTWAGTHHWFERDVPDHILVERARATLGRHVSHPHAIEVDAHEGCVTLRGKILKREVAPLVRAIGRVPGVQEIDNRLEQHDTGGNIPSLQGGSVRPGDLPDFAQRNWAPATRVLIGSVASALASYGAARRDAVGTLLGAAGAALALRAATNLEAARMVGLGGGRRAVDLQKAIRINAPVPTVFEFWSNFENFPHFMRNVREVKALGTDGQSRWTVRGPGHLPIEFDAVITKYVPNECLAWKTVKGSPVAHAGIIRFEPDESGGTRLQIRFSYNPPGGALGHAIALLLGDDPKTKMDEDLARMKTLIETGNPPRDAARPMTGAPDGVM